MRFWFAVGFLALTVFAYPANAGFKEGLSAFKKKDYATAMAEWSSLAEEGHALAKYNLAIMYRKGLGVKKDQLLSLKWYQDAADSGLAKAQYSLALFYEKGRGGLPKNATAAVNLYMQAAESGHSYAQYSLASHLEDGRGTERDLVEAMTWYIVTAKTSKGKLRRKSAEARDKLKESLSDDEISMAEDFAREWSRDYLLLRLKRKKE